MKLIATRLLPGTDLKLAIQSLVAQHNIRAGTIASCVGSLSTLAIRLADSTTTLQQSAYFEIVSLMGTLTPEHQHLHISVADHQGQVWGGHLQVGNIIHTTAELMIHHYPEHQFSRQFDPNTGFTELTISPN
ncbi:DUF296 domain-containing protein [Vibrio sp. V27_P1S3P104]|uniref:PPC domain-containing DNA-binding protein n=1 Tax=unclassified Vibrio TaxID=2614977 RepID=UPI001372328D|nr:MULTISPECIES: DUF296 domain-containing protein [unclassified Vibrio]NAW69613.1 DUF296 domain-containing protein [Vibrio sp. V28_P6S34P95]NAX04015.1 DUF296 domain-containing protein [Vibrio sp. V30_P3S12P165]NAX33012.1 DUF296 domain-containing protein [Vibrio sp. V29_P1S30P107]NAX37517.1 DUF296 domain-containing protein [Vibrio sp. V27_P1S3P104]NAX41292.1 DUF296 domain-containing protein [Vibrio sp. V26_P1S5P106]